MKRIYEQIKTKYRIIVSIGLYFLFQHRHAKIKLSSYGFSHISVYKMRQWKFNIKKNRTRFYYTAELNGKKIFIKVGKNDSTMNNEIFVTKYLTECGIDFIPQHIISDGKYDENSSMLVLQFLPGMRKFRVPDEKQAFTAICGEFEDIYAKLRRFDSLHRDISVNNLMLSPDGRLIMCDFGIGVVPGSNIAEVDSLEHCGTYFILSGHTRIYDDAYSFLRMLDDCGIPEEFKQMDCYKRIERLVGAHTHSITVPPS